MQINDDDIRLEKNSNGNDVYIFDPYNPLNKEITKEDVETILSNYGINVPIYNFNLYKRAFIHRSYTRRPEFENTNNNIVITPCPADCIPLSTKSNERIEFIGDGILECVTKYYLYRRFPKENEGFMTEKKIALVKNEAIGKLAMELGLNKWFILSKYAESKQTRTNLKKLGCLFESFIGAVFLDFNKIEVNDEDSWFKNLFLCGPGFQMAQVFLENIFEKHVDWMTLIQNDDNYKNILQVIIQKEFKITPYYMEISQHNQDSGYHMGVYLCIGNHSGDINHYQSINYTVFKSFAEIHQYLSEHGKIFLFLGEGIHKIKKKAEQISCNEAIQHLKYF